MSNKYKMLEKFYKSKLLKDLQLVCKRNGLKEETARLDIKKRQLDGLVHKYNKNGELNDKDWLMFIRIYDEAVPMAKNLSEELIKRAEWAIKHPDFAKLEQVPVDVEFCYYASQLLKAELEEIGEEDYEDSKQED